MPGVLVALGFVAVAVVAVREFAVDRGWAGGTSWLRRVLTDLDGQEATTWVVVIGIVATVLGLLVLVAALKPARRTHLRTTVEADLWLSRGALAELAQTVADSQDDVVSALAQTHRGRKVSLSVVAKGHADEVARRIEREVKREVGDLTSYSVLVDVREVSR